LTIASSSTGTQRPQSPENAFPLENAKGKGDRAHLAQVLSNETTVRFTKLQDGDDLNELSTTLKSEHLLQAFPQLSTEPLSFPSRIEKDRYSFRRTCRESLRQAKETDVSLTPVQIIGHDRHDNLLPSKGESLPVPPNLLFFEICLEIFMGYNLTGLYNSKDPSLPRAAVMGGAVLAALRDKTVRKYFEVSTLEAELLGNDEEAYVQETERLRMVLNEYFLCGGQSSSVADGDVDIFLQPSP